MSNLVYRYPEFIFDDTKNNALFMLKWNENEVVFASYEMIWSQKDIVNARSDTEHHSLFLEPEGSVKLTQTPATRTWPMLLLFPSHNDLGLYPLNIFWYCPLCLWAGIRSRYSDSLRAGRSGDRMPVGVRFSAPVQTGPGAHPASSTMGTGSFPGVKRPGCGVDHPPPSRAEFKETVGLYL